MSEEVIDSEQPTEPEQKQYRRRKRRLHKNIRNQMEFYFSDANLSKNRFIGQLMQQDPFIDLSVFLGFNKIKSLTTTIEDIAGSLKNSTVLKLNEEGTKVTRITPFKPKLDSEECTIYVEQLPLDATHEWLKSKFSSFGEVVYVSIPKFKSTGRIKGFAFVEFECVSSAQKALLHYIRMGCCLPTQMLPEDLCSINAFQEEENQEMFESNEPQQEEEKVNQEMEDSNNKEENKEEGAEEEETPAENKKLKKKSKRKLDESLLDESSPNKNEDSNQTDDSKEKERASKRKKLNPEDESKQEEEKTLEENPENVENLECKETEKNTEEKETKKKRKRKKNKKMKIQTEEVSKMKIMPKLEWKRVRNKYLELQKNKMKNLKQYLNKDRWANNTPQNNQPKENPKEPDQKNTFEYIPGVILKVTFEEPIKDVKNFKLQAHGLENIKYIDISEGSNEAYIRFSSEDSASNALDKKFWENIQILEGNEDKNYWEKMEKDREERFQHRIKPKIRGRTKLLKRAEKALGKHIRFD